MTQPSEATSSGFFGGRTRSVQWCALVALSVPLGVVLDLTGLPAAGLLGPMIAGIVLGTNGGTITAPKLPVLASQAIVGGLVASAITADIFTAFLKDWPLLLGVVLVILATSSLLGWMISRFKVLPGTTAVWGIAPGAASAMMVMAGAFGADPRLVAFTQYLRVVCVAATASLVARLWVGPASTAAAHASVLFPPLPWVDVTSTLLVLGFAGGLGIVLRAPAGALLFPMVAGAVLEAMGLLTIVLPPWLLALSYAFLGWSVGLAFTRDILRHATRALPQVILAIVVMIGVSAALALVLVKVAGIDPLTAYLATSPGGMDSVAIIGASSKVDLSFVMALQTLRFIIVLIAGPPLARFVARRL